MGLAPLLSSYALRATADRRVFLGEGLQDFILKRTIESSYLLAL
jgi:hypothetical protein